jgi:hypothetical protein
MIQRKQSVYLLLVAVLMSWTLLRPYAEMVLRDGYTLVFYSLSIQKHSTIQEFEYLKYTVPLFLLILLTGTVNLVNIFLFNRRLVQIRLCIASYDYMRHTFRLAAIFPIFGIIMNFLASRGIHQDEMLVKSYDRIR